MIVFDLQCKNNHKFEGWFEDSQTYEEQQKKGLIACPSCNDTNVFKVLSTFAIKSSNPLPKIDGNAIALGKITKEIADYVENNFDNVGADFSKEALKIHYGVSEPRNIRGVSTKTEEKTLKEEGVQFFKVPMPETSDTDS
ncbi:MAG: DUF1178 family protein [Desulfobacterales bacterium]|nr:DUF1178 family protein [Desulfobacterales bacterium]